MSHGIRLYVRKTVRDDGDISKGKSGAQGGGHRLGPFAGSEEVWTGGDLQLPQLNLVPSGPGKTCPVKWPS